MQVIYLDVLLAVNLFVNYFLLLSVKLFFHSKVKRWRMILAAVIGSLFSLMIFLPDPGLLLTFLIKGILGVLLVWLCFGYQQRGIFIKTVLGFFGVNFLYAGVMMALWIFVCPVGMYWNNGVAYFHISALALVIGTIAAYIVVRVICFLWNKRVHAKELYQIKIIWNQKEANLSAFYDTGNRLIDPFTGHPVVICEYQAVKNLLPASIQEVLESGQYIQFTELLQAVKFHLIPFQTVGGESFIVGFAPDQFYLEEKPVSGFMIGITVNHLSHGEFQAVLPAKFN